MAGSKDHGDGAQGGPRHSRRGLLAGAAGALGVLAAESVVTAQPAQATQGNPVILGQDNTGATARTELATTIGETAILAEPGGVGVHGFGTSNAGVWGSANLGSNTNGVLAVGDGTGSGVLAVGGGNSGMGLFAQGGSANGDGVHGIGTGTGTGVVGFGVGTGTGVSGSGGNLGGIGVVGTGTGSGAGVTGTGAGSGAGVVGTGGSSNGDGVRGFGSGTGNGVLAENAAGGNALRVLGIAAFSRSGVLTVAAGASSATQTGVALTAASLVLATVQQDQAGVWVRSAVPNIGASSFTIHLSKAVKASITVAWFVVN